jgi:hypothetical protein
LWCSVALLALLLVVTDHNPFLFLFPARLVLQSYFLFLCVIIGVLLGLHLDGILVLGSVGAGHTEIKENGVDDMLFDSSWSTYLS